MIRDPDTWPRVREVFEGALALPVHERAVYVETSCGGDAGLRAEVERMLASHEQAGAFLEQPAPTTGADTTTHLEGRRIGPYLLSSRMALGACARSTRRATPT